MNLRIAEKLADAGFDAAVPFHWRPRRPYGIAKKARQDARAAQAFRSWDGFERASMDGFPRRIRALELHWARQMAGLNKYPHERLTTGEEG